MVQALRYCPSRLTRVFQRLALVAGVLLATLPEAHAGFLDFLFGHPAPAPVQSPSELAPPSGGKFSRRPVFRHKSAANHPSAARMKAALCCKDGSDPINAVMNDPTLRKGDAVMLSQGMMVFEGSGNESVHHPSDFVVVPKAVSLSSKDRGRIMAVSSNRAQPAQRAAPAVDVARAAAQQPVVTTGGGT
jgi:hypothetical protein